MELKSVYEAIDLNTEKYMELVSLETRKKSSQYFTPFSIAKYMCSNIELADDSRVLRVLEPSAGTGRLVAAYLLGLEGSQVEEVIIDIYELDEKLIPILIQNVEIVSEYLAEKNIVVHYRVYCDNFLEHNFQEYYDVIIGNPPYKKIRKSSSESLANFELVHGQPNLYGLFIGRGAKLLNDNGQLIYLVPRSFFNGKYFKRIREFINNSYSLSFIHSFESRTKVINNEILQELVIVKIEKRLVDEVLISHSVGFEDIGKSEGFTVENDVIWDINNVNIRLPIKKDHIEVIRLMSKFNHKLNDYNLRFKTGPVVDFRVAEYISTEQVFEKYFPLIWCANFGEYDINWPLIETKYAQYASSDIPKSNLLECGNYLLIKRFSSKEESKCLKVNKISKEDCSFEKFGVENHVNYIKVPDEDENVLFGLYIIFNSTMYNNYFSIINGTTQINVTDLNQLPMPEYSMIRSIGLEAKKKDYLTSKECEELFWKHVKK